MAIIEQLNRAGQKAQKRVVGYAEFAVDSVRGTAQKAAKRVAAVRTPVKTLAEATGRLNDLSHRYVEQLVRQQVQTLEGILTDGAERLERVARADNLKTLVADQAELLSASRERLKRDLKATWAIAASTGREIGAVAVETYAQLIHGAKTVSKPAAKRASARPRKATSTRKSRVAA